MVIPQRIRLKLPPEQLALKIKDFGYHRITVSFDEENFLMFDYPYDEHMNNIMIVENFEGDLLFAEQYNCGYGGYGPGQTEEVLKLLGLNDHEADRLKWMDGFQISFNQEGVYTPEENMERVPFRRSSDKIDLSSAKTVCNLKKRQLYFIAPQRKAFTTLFRTLDLLKIESVKVYIGKDNTPYYDFSMPYIPLNIAERELTLKGSFIIFEARPFDVICFVGATAPASIINMLTLYALGFPLLRESAFGEYIILDTDHNYNESTIKKLTKVMKSQKDIYSSIKVQR